jgi:hypothetical protein
MIKPGMEPLVSLVGEWRIEAFGGAGRCIFEWDLGGAFLVQRTEVDLPEAPSTLSVIALGPEGEGFTQHYFDSRGVVRTYSMTFADGEWTLLRESEDFSPLDFRQRYTGRFSEDGKRIHGTWEINEGGTWDKDFDLNYVRLDP